MYWPQVATSGEWGPVADHEMVLTEPHVEWGNSRTTAPLAWHRQECWQGMDIDNMLWHTRLSVFNLNGFFPTQYFPLKCIEWRFYALLASKAIFRARTYSCNLFSPVMMITWWMKLGGNLWPWHDAHLFSICGIGSFIYPVAQTWLANEALYLPSHGGLGGGEVKVHRHKADLNCRPVGAQSNTPATRPRWPPQVEGSIIPRVLKGGGNLLPIGGDCLGKEPSHV